MLSSDSVRKPPEVTSVSGSSADENLWPMPNFSGLLTAALGGYHLWNLMLLLESRSSADVKMMFFSTRDEFFWIKLSDVNKIVILKVTLCNWWFVRSFENILNPAQHHGWHVFQISRIVNKLMHGSAKAWIKPEADLCAVDSPKKGTNELVFLQWRVKKQRSKTNLFVRFFVTIYCAQICL